jgi:putative transposase
MIQLTAQQLDGRPADASIRALCASVGLPRSTFYRQRDPEAHLVAPEEMELRDAIHRIALEWPAYGYRRITMELRRSCFECNQQLAESLLTSSSVDFLNRELLVSRIAR